MKSLKTLIVLASSILLLTSCGGGSSSSTGSTTSPTTTTTEPQSTFPSSEVQAFLAQFGIKTEVPAPYSLGEWDTYEDYEDYGESLCFYFGCYVADSGQIGKNSIEDTYKAKLQKSGYTIDDSEYEDYGYFATPSGKEFELQFYTYEGTFYFYVNIYVNKEVSTGFPSESFDKFLKELEITSKVPVPSISGECYYAIIASESGYTFNVFAEDKDGTIETAYKTALGDAGFVVDESEYETYGNLAYLEDQDFMIQFYTYEGYFVFNFVY